MIVSRQLNATVDIAADLTTRLRLRVVLRCKMTNHKLTNVCADQKSRISVCDTADGDWYILNDVEATQHDAVRVDCEP